MEKIHASACWSIKDDDSVEWQLVKTTASESQTMSVCTRQFARTAQGQGRLPRCRLDAYEPRPWLPRGQPDGAEVSRIGLVATDQGRTHLPKVIAQRPLTFTRTRRLLASCWLPINSSQKGSSKPQRSRDETMATIG